MTDATNRRIFGGPRAATRRRFFGLLASAATALALLGGGIACGGGDSLDEIDGTDFVDGLLSSTSQQINGRYIEFYNVRVDDNGYARIEVRSEEFNPYLYVYSRATGQLIASDTDPDFDFEENVTKATIEFDDTIEGDEWVVGVTTEDAGDQGGFRLGASQRLSKPEERGEFTPLQ